MGHLSKGNWQMMHYHRSPLKWFLLIFIILEMSISSCEVTQDDPAPRSDFRLKITATPVIRGDIRDTVAIFGRIVLRQEAYLSSQFAGRLTDFSLLIGDVVQNEQRVGTIVPAIREALLQVKDHLSGDLKPLVQEQMQPIPLLSPIAGTVLAVYHHAGDVVERGEHIARIGDLSALDVLGDLPVQWLPALKAVSKVTVQFLNLPHPPLELPVAALGGAADETNQTIPIRISLPNPKRLFRPGMKVMITFPDQIHQQALLVPRTALLEEEGIFSVFVIHGNRVEKRRVTVGILHKDQCEILAGLQEGERVATRKVYSLQDGMEVVVQ